MPKFLEIEKKKEISKILSKILPSQTINKKDLFFNVSNLYKEKTSYLKYLKKGWSWLKKNNKIDNLIKNLNNTGFSNDKLRVILVAIGISKNKEEILNNISLISRIPKINKEYTLGYAKLINRWEYVKPFKIEGKFFNRGEIFNIPGKYFNLLIKGLSSNKLKSINLFLNFYSSGKFLMDIFPEEAVFKLINMNLNQKVINNLIKFSTNASKKVLDFFASRIEMGKINKNNISRIINKFLPLLKKEKPENIIIKMKRMLSLGINNIIKRLTNLGYSVYTKYNDCFMYLKRFIGLSLIKLGYKELGQKIFRSGRTSLDTVGVYNKRKTILYRGKLPKLPIGTAIATIKSSMFGSGHDHYGIVIGYKGNTPLILQHDGHGKNGVRVVPLNIFTRNAYGKELDIYIPKKKFVEEFSKLNIEGLKIYKKI